MKGQSKFLPCFEVIQDVLGLIDMGKKIIKMQVFGPAFIPVALETEKLLPIKIQKVNPLMLSI